MAKTNDKVVLVGTNGRKWLREEITEREAAELLNVDASGNPRLANPEKGSWPKVERAWQDNYIKSGRKHYVEIPVDLLIKTVPWWINGSGGEIGKGGWQKRIPMRAFAKYLPSSVPFAAMFEAPVAAPVVASTTNPITSTEASRLIGCSVTKVHALRKQGALTATRTSTGLFIFDRLDVERYRASRTGAIVRGRQTTTAVH
jgi:hypothetical protein